MVIGERTEEMCALYTAGLPVKQIAERFGVLNPAVWKALRRGGVVAPYRPRTPQGPGRPVGGGEPGYTASRLSRSVRAEHRREAGQPPVPSEITDRTPCLKCGVRGDIGCEHNPATGAQAR